MSFQLKGTPVAIGVVNRFDSVMMSLCGSPLASFTDRKPSAPAPPDLLTTTSGSFISLCLTTMPWISPEYFEHHYPREWSRRAVFYVGVTLVRPDKRRDHIFTMMAEHVAQRVASVEGVLGYDLCGFNDRSRSLGRVIEHIGAPHFETVQPIDVQTYYAAQTHGYRIKEEAGQNS